MEYNDIDWTKRGNELLLQLESYRRNRILANIQQLDQLLTQLEKQDIFNHQDFKKIRARLGSQQDWAEVVGVSQATIGNYERNVTYPNKPTRASLANAIREFKSREASNLNGSKDGKIDVDVAEAKAALDNTILSAALTDFRFDPEGQRVITVPFTSDTVKLELASLEQDRRDLLNALDSQATTLALSLSDGVNANVSRIIQSLKDYASETQRERPNPRKLFRLGTILNRAFASDEIAFSVREFDRIAFDGFSEDHSELMRLYYREALAKAQQVDAIVLAEAAEIPEASDFSEIADLIASVKDEDGEAVFSDDIPTLLRDISREIEENKESEVLSSDSERRKALRKRRIEAIKNGSILVGRFLVFTAFFIAVDPAVALTTASSIATIVGVVEQSAPGTVRKYYERIREMLPFLPKFPSKK